MQTLPHVTIYTDGACLGNPGPGGYGTILQSGGRRKELSAGFRRTTNNRMELMAAIVGLQTLKRQCEVTLHTDSRYLVDGIGKGWAKKWRKNDWKREGKPVPNADLWGQLLDLCERHSVTFVWVPGHAGVTENEYCDQLSRQAAQGKELAVDREYEQLSRRP